MYPHSSFLDLPALCTAPGQSTLNFMFLSSESWLSPIRLHLPQTRSYIHLQTPYHISMGVFQGLREMGSNQRNEKILHRLDLGRKNGLNQFHKNIQDSRNLLPEERAQRNTGGLSAWWGFSSSKMGPWRAPRASDQSHLGL